MAVSENPYDLLDFLGPERTRLAKEIKLDKAEEQLLAQSDPVSI